jgi:hypothetical protein
VQMYLFKAKQVAISELERAYVENGVTAEQVRAFLDANPRFDRALHKAPHAYAGTAADLVAQVAPYITKTRAQRWRGQLEALASRSGEAARKSPHMVVKIVKSAVDAAPEVAARLKEDVALLREARRAKKIALQPVMDAAAE